LSGSQQTDGIGALAARAGVTPDTIRYYERVGLLPPPRRDAAGRRRYDERTADLLELVRALREAGLSIADVLRVVGAKRPGRPLRENLAAVERTLVELREGVDERRRALDAAAAVLDGLLDEVRQAQP
jgi:DNA-binding transcriptional MerR regulator